MFVIDLRTAFDLLDRNQDGRITVGELQFMLQNLGIQLRDEYVQELIKEATQTGKYLINYFFILAHFVLLSKRKSIVFRLKHCTVFFFSQLLFIE